jgi:hypothetical protein
MMLVAGLTAVPGVLAQPYPYVEWTRTYGGSGDDVARSLKITDNGSYMIADSTNSFGSGGYDVWLLRLDSMGDTLWTCIYGDGYDQNGNSLQIPPDGGYIVAGHTWSYGAGAMDVYLLKTEPDTFVNGAGGGVLFVPSKCQLQSPYPNPFNSALKILYDVPEMGRIS